MKRTASLAVAAIAVVGAADPVSSSSLVESQPSEAARLNTPSFTGISVEDLRVGSTGKLLSHVGSVTLPVRVACNSTCGNNQANTSCSNCR
jgi:hypothetical protein